MSKQQRMLIWIGSLAVVSLLFLGGSFVLAAQISDMLRVTTSSSADRSSSTASLNSDGSKVAFHSDSDFLGQSIPNGQSEIWLYDTATMTVTRVTTASDSSRDSSDPSLSGDSSKVAFESDSDFLGESLTDNQNEIWLYDTGNLTFTRLTLSAGTNRDSRNPSISADGSKIAFDGDADLLGQGIVDGQNEIWLYDTATMTVTRVTIASDGLRDSLAPSISADGTKIAFYSDSDFLGQSLTNDQFEIWLYNTATMTVTRVTTASDGSRDSFSPSLSMDGSKVAFESDSDFLSQSIPDDQTEIWLYDTGTLATTRATQASDSIRGSFNASISHDGSKVAFYSDSDFLGQSIPVGQYEIWLYETATLTVTHVTSGTDAGRGSFSPILSGDGYYIAYQSDSDFLSEGIPAGQYEIWLSSFARNVYLPLIIK